MKRIAALLLGLTILAGCSSWERTTFQTLSASKATIDQAQADYESRAIPHTACVYGVINKAKAAQTLAVDAMMTYESVKGTSGAAAAEALVNSDLTQLLPAITSVKTLSTSTCTGGAQ